MQESLEKRAYKELITSLENHNTAYRIGCWYAVTVNGAFEIQGPLNTEELHNIEERYISNGKTVIFYCNSTVFEIFEVISKKSKICKNVRPIN